MKLLMMLALIVAGYVAYDLVNLKPKFIHCAWTEFPQGAFGPSFKHEDNIAPTEVEALIHRPSVYTARCK